MTFLDWTGAEDGDITDADNYSPSAAPTDGDIVRVQGTPAHEPDSGDLSAVTLAKFIRASSYAGDLAFVVNATEVFWNNTGNEQGSLTGAFGSIYCDCLGKNAGALSIDGAADWLVILKALGGKVACAPSMALAHVRVMVETNVCGVTLGAGITGLTSFVSRGGIHTVSCDFSSGVMIVSGGEVTIADGDPGEIYVLGTGKVIGNTTNDFGRVEVAGPQGRFDGTKNASTGAIEIDPRVYPGGVMDLSQGNWLLPNDWAKLGGEILFPAGTKLAIA